MALRKWMHKLLLSLVLAGLLLCHGMAAQPNIVFVISDDQGYGDLACHGNPVIKTPHIDQLASESVALDDYHVAPTCSPTRGSLLTGHWTNRTGVWHTVNGRSMLRENEVTLGQLLKDSGYRTGMFGKWHLGDNYPYRPEDRGFDEVYRHGGGGVGQTPDVWDNAYFDGSYFHNGKVEAAKGFCTDVFFAQGQAFIRDSVEKKQPFFAYISTNAPHGPLHAPQKYLDIYKDQKKAIAAFFGMITNIDDNVGATRALLKELGIYENTIFVFTTDNGTASGGSVFNAGMRGTKGSPYDGGHRVPFFLHWPAAGMNARHVVNTVCHACDIVPTMLNLVGAKKPESLSFDGVSLKPLLDSKTDVQWPERFLVTDSQRVRDPIKWKDSSVMSQGWRLINGKELYEMASDPGQKSDVATKHPEQVSALRGFYEKWWAELEPTFAQTTEIYLGHPEHPVVSLTGHDWIQNDLPPWNQGHIRSAYGLKKKSSKHQGHWAVKVLETGMYDISLRRWPLEADQPINVELSAGENVPGASKAFRAVIGKGISAASAALRIDDQEIATTSVQASDVEVTFSVKLEKGSHKLAPYFVTDKGELGAYYTIVTKK